MELWLEYLNRHGLTTIKVDTEIAEPPTPRIIVRDNEWTTWQGWTYFVFAHRPVFKHLCPQLEQTCDLWLNNDHPAWTRYSRPTMAEQQIMLFAAVPYLRTVWARWSENIDLLRTSALETVI